MVAVTSPWASSGTPSCFFFFSLARRLESCEEGRQKGERQEGRRGEGTFSGKWGISSRTVARTSPEATLDKARYSTARCCSSASGFRKLLSAFST